MKMASSESVSHACFMMSECQPDKIIFSLPSPQQVQGTNDSATLSKCSTSQTGYYKDSFVSCFVTHCPRRAPIIHWGYWIRNQTLEWIQNEFLDCKQLIYKQVCT